MPKNQPPPPPGDGEDHYEQILLEGFQNPTSPTPARSLGMIHAVRGLAGHNAIAEIRMLRSNLRMIMWLLAALVFPLAGGALIALIVWVLNFFGLIGG